MGYLVCVRIFQPINERLHKTQLIYKMLQAKHVCKNQGMCDRTNQLTKLSRMDTYKLDQFISAFRVLSSFNVYSNLNILKATLVTLIRGCVLQRLIWVSTAAKDARFK